MKLGEDQSKTLCMGLFISPKFLVVVTLYARVNHLTYSNHNCVSICVRKTVSKPLLALFLYFFLRPVGPSIWDEIANNRSTIILRGLC